MNDDTKDGEVKVDRIVDFRTPVLGCYTNLWKIGISVRLPHEPWTCTVGVFTKLRKPQRPATTPFGYSFCFAISV